MLEKTASASTLPPQVALIDNDFNQFQALLVDWDGVVSVGRQLLPQALSLLCRYRERIAIVSNNSSDLPEDFSVSLQHRGVDIPRERILLAGVEAVKCAIARGAKRCLVLGSRKLAAFAASSGLVLARDNADLVLLLRDSQFSYRKLERAANAVARGAHIIVANPDVTHPGLAGNLVPETGALLAAIIACVGRDRMNIEVVGKPGPTLFLKACAALQADPAQAIMIGDNPATDIAGAAALGMASLLVDNRLNIIPTQRSAVATGRTARGLKSV